MDTGNTPLRELTLIGATCLGRAARRAANLVTRVYNQRLGRIGIEVTQFTILATIALGRAKSASELAEFVGVERSTLTRNLERLATAGLVAAEAGNGRRVIHRLTDKGELVLSQAVPLWREAQRDLLARLPETKDDAIREDFRLLRHAAQGLLADSG